MNPILIVDDEAAIAMLVRRILTEAGYRCQAVTDSRAAANLLEKNRYDLVLLDVMMPHLDGYDLLAYLRPTGTPCIFITAKDAVAERVRGLNSGADDYIVKPFDMSVLKARIRNILNERQRLREAILYSNNASARNEYSNKLDKEFMDKVISVVQKELSNSEFQINDLCRELAMSRTAFYNKLKSLTGQGPNDFIRIYRLERSKEYLADHRYSIAEVSDMVGFSDAKYFSVCFKKQFGLSPSRF
jgi:DNA-binding response OmpR family regulator